MRTGFQPPANRPPTACQPPANRRQPPPTACPPFRSYEHTNAICNVLNGVPPPRLPPELEDKLKGMFVEIQEPFERNCPPQRKNFLSYGFTLYKFCELLGADEYLAHFPLLKSSEKLYAQDQIWKKICKDLQWEFIASV
jgi:hypothetical protein